MYSLFASLTRVSSLSYGEYREQFIPGSEQAFNWYLLKHKYHSQRKLLCHADTNCCLNLSSHLTVLNYTYFGFLQVLRIYCSLFDLKISVHTFLYAWMLFLSSFPWPVPTYPLDLNLNVTLSEMLFLTSPMLLTKTFYLRSSWNLIPLQFSSMDYLENFCLNAYLFYLTTNSVEVCLIHQSVFKD